MTFNLLKLNKSKACALVLMLPLTLCAFAQSPSKEKKPASEKKDRVEINYKQRHSKTGNNQDYYADGIKIKKDLSLIDKVQESRLFDMDEIPADELYGGVWSSSHVNIYSRVENVPDTFKVNLSNFSMPTMGHTTSNYGQRRRRMHYGIDLKVQVGDTIYAAFDGRVRICQFEGKGYGNYVVLRHPNGLETVYGHLSGFLVKEDEVVRSGEPIALGGNTGRSTGSHLHFEFRFLGKPINPNKIVDFDNKVCHKDYYTITSNAFDNTGARSSVKYARSSDTNKYISGKVNYHRVKSGDSLYKVAKKYGVSVKNLCKLNKLTESTKLRPGQSLRIS